MQDDVRYQDQPWHKKFILNVRHELTVPYFALKCWLRSRFNKDKPDFRLCWSLAKGMADFKKKHYFTWDEVKERMEKLKNEHNFSD